jgi:putative redox protein
MPTVTITRTQPDYGFTATDETGNALTMDNAPEHGRLPYGIRPMQGLLIALGGCSGIDIVSILKKQRQPLGSLTLEITGEREKDVVPALWKTVHIRFLLGGGVDLEKANYAAKLSVEKYCSVAETLRRAGCHITWEVQLS